MRQLNISIDDRVYENLSKMAGERGYKVLAYGKMLFDAGYAAAVGHGANLSTEEKLE